MKKLLNSSNGTENTNRCKQETRPSSDILSELELKLIKWEDMMVEFEEFAQNDKVDEKSVGERS